MKTASRSAPSAAQPVHPVVAAERQRARSLIALGQQRNVDPTLINAMIDAGTSVESARASIIVGENREAFRPFATFAEQLVAVRHAARGVVDPRLKLVAGTPSGMNESVGSEGGFAVQTNFVDGILDRAYEIGQILSRVREFPFGNAQNLKLTAWGETSRADGQRLGGVRALWAAEADQFTASMPKPRHLELSAAKKLIALWFLTSELEADGAAASSAAQEAFAEEISFVVEDAIVNGPGAGKPLGIMKTPALISQAVEGTQTIANSAQFIGLNVTKMFARLVASRDPSATAWLVNAELLPTLYEGVLPSAGGTPTTALVQFGDARSVGYGTMLERPIIPVEYCQPVGTPGDLILADLSQYALASRNLAGARSMHLKFLSDEVAFRIVLRVDGLPIWANPTTPKNGSNTVSPVVNLAVRV